MLKITFCISPIPSKACPKIVEILESNLRMCPAKKLQSWASNKGLHLNYGKFQERKRMMVLKTQIKRKYPQDVVRQFANVAFNVIFQFKKLIGYKKNPSRLNP